MKPRLAQPVPDPRNGESPTQAPPERPAIVRPLLYRLNQLPDLLGVSLETIGRMRARGAFPKPDLTLGSRMPCWKPETIVAWIDKQANGRKGGRS